MLDKMDFPKLFQPSIFKPCIDGTDKLTSLIIDQLCGQFLVGLGQYYFSSKNHEPMIDSMASGRTDEGYIFCIPCNDIKGRFSSRTSTVAIIQHVL